MKLDCSVLISPAKKPVQSIICIGKATRGFKLSVQTRNKGFNREYLLDKENVKRVIDKFSSQGKATICFKNVDVMISEAKPEKLRQFLTVVHQCLNPSSKNPLSLPSISSSGKENLRPRPKRLEITERKVYFTPGNSFPSSLEMLGVSVQIKTVDARWFGLRNLTRLNLDENRFGELNRDGWRKFEGIAKLERLQDLSLHGNHLKFLPVSFIEALPLGLMRLGVSDNELGYLPPKLARLTKLRYLSAANNQIEFIPENFHQLRGLIQLSLANNRLKYIPYFMRHFRLQQLDLSANSMYPGAKQVLDKGNCEVPSLLEIVAAAVLNKKSLSKFADAILPIVLSHDLYSYVLTCSTCLKFIPANGFHSITSKSIDPASFSEVSTRIGEIESRVIKCRRCK